MRLPQDELVPRRSRRSSLTRLGLATSFALVSLALSPLSCVSRPDDDGSDESETGGAGPSTGASSSSGGKNSGTGGKASTGGSGGGGTGGRLATGGSDGGSVSTGGAIGFGGQGGATSICELPFESGPCEAAFGVYYHNAQTGTCEPTIYGGCGGNENRFATLEECEEECGSGPLGASCEVNGVTYPSGSSGVPDPTSCNTCGCEDGEITGCTEIHCPESCPEGSTYGTECAECGPTDACLTVRHACLPTCDSQEECSNGWCGDGVCRRGLCG